MRFCIILSLLVSACSLRPLSIDEFRISGGIAPVRPDAVETFHKANAGKYFAFEVYRLDSIKNMAGSDDPSKGQVVQFILFRFNEDGTLQSVRYDGLPFNSGKPDVNFDSSPAYYNKSKKTYGETSIPINPAALDDPQKQWSIRKVRFNAAFTRVQVAEDILGQGDWIGSSLIDIPLVIGSKTEVFAQYGMP